MYENWISYFSHLWYKSILILVLSSPNRIIAAVGAFQYMSCWQNCVVWLAYIGHLLLYLSVVHFFLLCDWSGLVHPITDSVFWDVTLCIAVAIYQREGKKIQAARTSGKFGIYLPDVTGLPPKRQQSEWLVAATDGTQYRAGATVSTADPHALLMQCSLKCPWRPLCVYGSEFLAGCCQQDELPRTRSCVALACSRDKLDLKVRSVQNFVHSFEHDARGFVCRGLCLLTSERICKKRVFISSVKN